MVNIDSRIKLMMIFVTKTKKMALSKPYLVFLQQADQGRAIREAKTSIAAL